MGASREARTTDTSKILAVIPAYRERKHIGEVVRATRALGYPVVVVDDGSEDGTADEARTAGAKVLRLATHLGYGAALQCGYRYALENGFQYVVQLDGDGQHDPNQIPRLLAPVLAGQADLAVGSRFLAPGSDRVPWPRRLGQLFFGTLAGLIIGQRVTDPTSGLQALSRPVIEMYDRGLFPDDFPDADMFVLLHRLRFRFVEVPTPMRAGDGGSMHAGIVRPLYYLYKMSLALLISLIRKLPERGSG